jgi:hypothetical protein
MKNTDIRLFEGTSALAPLEQLTEEFAKDKWDARLIPGLRYAPHTFNYYIDFQRIPEIFRPVVKEHIKCKLTTGVSASTLHRCTYCVGNFLTFFVQQYPHAQTLQTLSKQDIDMFIMALKVDAEYMGGRITINAFLIISPIWKSCSAISNGCKVHCGLLTQRRVSSGRAIIHGFISNLVRRSSIFPKQCSISLMLIFSIYIQPTFPS